MAWGLFKKHLADNNIENIEVKSAGLSAFPGDTVSANSVTAAKKRGADISSHRAKGVTPEDLLTVDLFVCMSQSHSSCLTPLCGEERVMTLNVSDPYMQSEEVYESCCRQIEGAFPDILEKMKKLAVIRPMTEEDIPVLCEIERECFSEPWSDNSFKEELTNGTARFFVIKSDDVIFGYIGANNICSEVYITNVAVSGKYREKGFGKRLVRFLILQSSVEYADFVTLEVRRSNENAIRLYEKCGFTLAGERKDFYSKPREDALLYTLKLR